MLNLPHSVRVWVALDGSQLAMLLDGIDLGRVRRPVHWRPRRRIDNRAAV